MRLSNTIKSNKPKLKAQVTKLILGLVTLAVLVVLFRQYQIPNCQSIQSYVTSWGYLAPILFLFVYIVSTVAFIPGVVVSMAAGLSFGPWWGTLVVSLGSTLGASLAFLIARYLARDLIERMLSEQKWFTKFQETIEARGFAMVVFVRLVPLFPFNGLNYACGLTRLRLKDYVLGSAIGMLPGTFAYVYLGATGCQIMDSFTQGNFNLLLLPDTVKRNLLIAVGLLVLLAILPIFLKKRLATHSRTHE